MTHTDAHTDVVVIGAGMAGLANARWLRAVGFEVAVLEGHDALGGQWDRNNRRSGVWPQMRTNTVRSLTRFSDVDYPESVPVFPRNGDVLALLQRYAEQYSLHDCLRLGAEVSGVRREGEGYVVTYADAGGEHTLSADRVVVATGRYNKPEVPPIAGLDTFAGKNGVIHAFRYKDPDQYRDREVVVCGGSISALEIVSDLAMLGAKRVHLAQRRQRYVMPKMVAGTPIESYVFTRADAVTLQTGSTPQLEQAIAKRVLGLGGEPTRYGAPAPNRDLARAGVTGNQHYLNLVAEDRISVHPWIREVDGRKIIFTDASTTDADAIIVATGFDLHLPFLAEEIRGAIRLTKKSMELAQFTFHPDLAGLAFAGLWSQLGAYAVPLEQQARWIAYTWADVVKPPSTDQLHAWVAQCRENEEYAGYREQHEMAVRFARLAGVDPDPAAHPNLSAGLVAILPRALCTADSFRLVGADVDPSAADRVCRDFRRYAPPPVRARVEALISGDPTGTGEPEADSRQPAQEPAAAQQKFNRNSGIGPT